MKKLTMSFIWVTMSILAACSDSEYGHRKSTPVDKSAPITFTIPDYPTPDDAAIAAAVRESGFGMYVVFQGEDSVRYGPSLVKYPDMKFNVKATWDASSMKYVCTPQIYWPKKAMEKVAFYAYAPYADENSHYIEPSDDEFPLISPRLKYLSGKHTIDQVDLLWAVSLDNTEKASVVLDFKHVLSQVSFEAKLAEPLDVGTSIRVMSLAIYYSYIGLKNEVYVDFINAGARWGVSLNYYPTTFPGEGEVLNDGIIEVPAHPVAVLLSASDKFLKFIPQSYDEGDVYCMLDYEVVQDDGEGHEEVTSYMEVKLPLLVPDNGQWQQGKHYVYTINLSVDDEPTMEVGTDEWYVAE